MPETDRNGTANGLPKRCHVLSNFPVLISLFFRTMYGKERASLTLWMRERQSAKGIVRPPRASAYLPLWLPNMSG